MKDIHEQTQGTNTDTTSEQNNNSIWLFGIGKNII